MTLLEQSPHILARLYLWHKPFNELVAYRPINHNTCQAADLVLFSRDGAESIRLQEIFLEQWAALTPEVLRTRINTSLISYLRRHIHYKTVSLRYRFLGMIVLAAFHNIHLEIDDELFKQLSSRLFAGIFQQQTLKPLHMVFNYLSSNQIKSISVSIRDILENEKHYDYDTALFHLTALAPKLPQDSLLSFLPFLVDGLATSSERTRTFVIECLKAFVSKLTTKHQLALCSRLLSNLQGSMISPSSIYQCLGSFESLLSPSVRRVIIPQILQEMRTHQTANRQHLIQCNVMFTSSFTKAEQDQLFMVLLANLKCGDENRRIHTLQEIDSLKHLSSPFVSRVIPFITNKLMDNSVLCRQLAQTLLVRLAPGLKKKYSTGKRFGWVIY